MADPVSFEWRPITDLPTDYQELEKNQLRQLAPLWGEQREELEASDSVKEFNQRLLRRQAIETGLIERLYTLDRGITQLLVEQGLDASLIPHNATDKNPQHVIRLIQDQHDAVEGLFTFVKQDRHLSTSYIKELHAALTSNQSITEALMPDGRLAQVELLRGEYKRRPNNPRRPDGTMHEYAPPEHVAAEMDQLVTMYRGQEERGVAPEVISAWLHHRFTQIHPFQDGNGRVARALASLVFLKAGWFPLLVSNDQRATYIDALEAADHGSLKLLVELFVRAQRNAFLSAISTAREVRDQERRVGAQVNAIREALAQRRENLSQRHDRAKDLARRLHAQALARFRVVATEIEEQIESLAAPGETFDAFADEDGDQPDRSRWNRAQIVKTVNELNYFANFNAISKWVRLGIDAPDRSELLVAFHGVGREYRGVVLVAACYYRKDDTGDGVTISDVTPLAEDAFQILYTDDLADLRRDFEKWLDDVVVKGLAMYQRSL